MDNDTSKHNFHESQNTPGHESPSHASDNNDTVAEENQNAESVVKESCETDKVSELEKKVEELKDLYVRAQAEMQNVQRRSHEEIKKARDYAITGFAKDIIVVKDYLEMALKDESGNFDAIKTGVDLTLKQLVQIFERHLIKEIDPKPQEKLDPHLHQAMTAVEENGVEPNVIVNVMQKGYALNERVLRPAMVTVTK